MGAGTMSEMETRSHRAATFHEAAPLRWSRSELNRPRVPSARHRRASALSRLLPASMSRILRDRLCAASKRRLNSESDQTPFLNLGASRSCSILELDTNSDVRGENKYRVPFRLQFSFTPPALSISPAHVNSCRCRAASKKVCWPVVHRTWARIFLRFDTEA